MIDLRPTGGGKTHAAAMELARTTSLSYDDAMTMLREIQRTGSTGATIRDDGRYVVHPARQPA